MVKDALKFFQAFIKEMIEIGGVNLPRAISTKLGAKLAQLYKERGLTDGFEIPLRQMYTVLKANPTISKIDENTYRVNVRHSRKFCEIGGMYNPGNAPIFQRNICIPYTLGFLTEFSSEFKYEVDVEECIIASNKRICQYCLKMKKKL
jgi:hypothetical protein